MDQIFYKITNSNECHNGYQYKDGLNVLNGPFNPVGSCVAGGLYFTTIDHIFDFLSFGCHLREVTLPPDCLWVKDPDGNKYRADKIILGNKYHLSKPETWQLLFEKAQGKVNKYIYQGCLFYAWKNDFKEVLKFLRIDYIKNMIEDGADVSDALNLMYHWNDYGSNYRQYTIEIIKDLIEKGININNLLDFVIRYRDMSAILYLIEKGVDINDALKLASERKDVELVADLLKRGGNIDVCANLEYFLSHRCITCILKDNGADMYEFDDLRGYEYEKYQKDSNTELVAASKNGDLTNVKYLVESGAKINTDNYSALIHASANGHLSVVKYLVESGAKVGADNYLALKYAAGNGHLDIVQYLVENGANIFADKNCAFRLACKNGHLAVVKFLVECGAKINVDDSYAYRIACRNGYLDMLCYLLGTNSEPSTTIEFLKKIATQYNHSNVVDYLSSKTN